MKFISLRMQNWRSYFGEHLIEFSTDADKPVTLLLGPNGAGKTALLNAFTWGLYGSFTAGFDEHHQLINLDALDHNSDCEALVEIKFEHLDELFLVKRTVDGASQLLQEYQVLVTKNGARTVEEDVHQILPKPLKDLFFFPAETFSTASVLKSETVGAGNSFDVGRAIRSLLSGDIYKNASEDLKNSIGSKTLKPPKNYKDETVASACKAYEQAQEELNAAEERKELLPQLLVDANEKLAAATAVAEMFDPEEIRKRQLKFNELNKCVSESLKVVERVRDLYVDAARNSHYHFAKNAIYAAVSRLDLAEKAGLMPPRIHESVIKKTLEAKTCALCHEKLSDDGIKRVKLLKERVSDAKVAVRGLEARTKLRHFVSRYDNELSRIREDVLELSKDLDTSPPNENANLRGICAVLKTCIDIAAKKNIKAYNELKEFNSSDSDDTPTGPNPIDVVKTNQARVFHLDFELKEISRKIEILENKKSEAFKDYSLKSSKLDDHKQKLNAIEILQEAKRYFDEAKKGLEEFGREDFENAINKTYSDLVSKNYEIKVDPEFGIKVFQAGRDTVIPLSQSEKTLLLIAFLGAIARLAPVYEKIAKNGEQLVKTGNVETSSNTGFPVVLDAPTSSLDEEYEKVVIEALTHLLPQVIVPISAKSVETLQNIDDKVGKAFVLELTSSEASNRVVNWSGKDFDYSKFDSDSPQAKTKVVCIR